METCRATGQNLESCAFSVSAEYLFCQYDIFLFLFFFWFPETVNFLQCFNQKSNFFALILLGSSVCNHLKTSKLKTNGNMFSVKEMIDNLVT